MKRIATLLVLLSIHFSAFATWSIIIIDPKTGEIGIAGASCTYSCRGIAKIAPGQGAIVVQAMSNSDARKKGLQMILDHRSPEEIIQALRAPEFDPEKQQYAIVSASYLDTPMTYTGTATAAYNGALTAKGVSVQGNTLASDHELKVIMDAVVNGQNDRLRIDEILMRALEAGSEAGGDKRCGEQRATCAFLVVAKPNDKPGRPYLDLEFFGQKRGGMNAVHLLRGKYEKWKRKHSA
ncbi:hypothetical protein BN8_00177 [Fibrisoma limi BUZ 3]|uniref:DUF1028 domain-containing protein n=1 Tax=Fibrisoma limi BUZ 3 TaxID=1185876 RepID=I2GBI6_9BACT|nr:DUF1028 domain-containing protein [Fibrisoma limi]CCH51260.1 hypothetical protein BN8_00177 [Fibrisoma limi BUZ 3]